ncbi:PHP domain-containing protein [Brassicibacter mesophilus]|uniref:PHP domain-containing protein n=1 Tax=Brassicibacter mesophilus TaxID=745119 RepID=UPI003D1A0696
MVKVDLHIHTTASDGLLHPYEVVDWANKKNIEIIAITDHDTTDGIKRAINRAKSYDIIVIPGIEFSCDFNGEEIHILGYYIDYESEILNRVTSRLKESRLIRGEKIVNKLINMGLKITVQDVKSLAGKGAVGRPHIARALINKGYADSIEEAFSKYIGRNRPAYVDRLKLSVKECIELIHSVGGVAVLAHPGLIESDKIISEVIKYEIDGIEVVHSKHSRDTMNELASLADCLGLIKTGGSDCHGTLIDNKPMLGDFYIDIEQFELLRDKASYYDKRSE